MCNFNWTSRLRIEKSKPPQVETVDDGLVSKWEIVKMCEPDYYPNNKGILS